MKIVSIRTAFNLAVDARTRGTFFEVGKGQSPGLTIKDFVHPERGPGVMITTDALKDKGKAVFVTNHNIVQTDYAKDDEPEAGKDKKKGK